MSKSIFDKSISAGVIITDGNYVLLCHVTGSKHFDLPKGKVEPGEELIDAAIRELYEETSIIVSKDALVDLGIFFYKKNKDLSLWLYKVNRMPDAHNLLCQSVFDAGKGIMKFEMDSFQNVKWENIELLVVPAMHRVLVDVEKIIKSM